MSTVPIEAFVEDLTTVCKVEIVHEWDIFQSKGAIGDSVIRREAVRFSKENDIPDGMIVVVMQGLAFEICRQFAKEFIDENGLDNS